MMRRRISLLLALCLVGGSMLILQSPTVVRAATPPLKCSKKTNHGKTFRYCAGRVKSKDGSVKLDTRVTLPATGDGPYPVILMLHGLGGSRLSFESKFPGQDGYVGAEDTVAGTGSRFHYNNLWFASKGYAVMNYTVRGFEESACIEKQTQSTDANPDLYGDSPACLPQLVSTSHEIKDSQYLLGRLIDRTLISATGVRFKVKKIGVTGVSYGGGHTWLLTRKNVWRSPRGTQIKLAAAAPVIGWTDIVDALFPNGVVHENHMPPTSIADRMAERVGVLKKSYADTLYTLMKQTTSQPFSSVGYLKTWFEEFNGPEPYDPAILTDAEDALLRKRSAYYVGTGSFQTPIFAVQGFTDDLFPVIQTVQMFNRLKELDPTYPIKMYAGDWGHPKAESDAAETAYIADSINTWMNHYLKGTGAAPAAQAEARITLCGPDIGDLYRAPTWEGLSEGSTLIADAGNYSLDTSANDLHVNAMDPVDAFTSDRAACRSTDTTVVTGNAAITQTALLADTTMLGIPEVTLSANPSAANMYIGARLWDVSADDTSQTLVDRGVFRLGDAGAQVANFHLNGNGYTFGVGHKIKIEFTATEAPSFKASTATGTISVSGVQATIPLAAASQKVAP